MWGISGGKLMSKKRAKKMAEDDLIDKSTDPK
jgi:hypothetical protein